MLKLSLFLKKVLNIFVNLIDCTVFFKYYYIGYKLNANDPEKEKVFYRVKLAKKIAHFLRVCNNLYRINFQSVHFFFPYKLSLSIIYSILYNL